MRCISADKRCLRLPIAAFGADAIGKRNTAQRTAIHRHVRWEAGRRRVRTAGEGDLDDVELVLQQLVHHLDEALDGHRLLGYDKTALWIGGAEIRLECWPFHRVRRRTVPDALLLIDRENRREERIVLAQDERVIEVLENVPGRLLNLVTREDHIDAGIDGIFDLQSQSAGMPVQVLRFASEAVEAMGVLDVEMSDGPNGLAAAVRVLVHGVSFCFDCRSESFSGPTTRPAPSFLATAHSMLFFLPDVC